MGNKKKIASKQNSELDPNICLKLSQAIPEIFGVTSKAEPEQNHERDFKTLVKLYKLPK